MSSTLRPAGIPSQRIRPTETENSSWYNVIGNRTPRSTVSKMKERAHSVFHSAPKTNVHPKRRTRLLPPMYTRHEDLHVEHEFDDGTRMYTAHTRVNLERFRRDERHLYVVELEADGKYSGDIHPVKNLREEDDVKHNPAPFPAKEGVKDKVSIMAKLDKTSVNGSAEWKIPVYVLRFNSTQHMIFDIDTSDQTPEGVERLVRENQGEVIAKINVIQRFALKSSILSASKGGIDLGSIDIKQLGNS